MSAGQEWFKDGASQGAYTHNSTNAYISVLGNTVSHDNSGNLTADHRGYSYEYDYENRLTKIKKSSGTVTVAEFVYDALGRRIEKLDAIGSETTRFYYDNQRVLLEADWSGSAETDERYFVYGNYIDEVLVMRDDLADTPDDHYYGHDHLFSAVVIFDDTGTVEERYEYDAYGKAVILDSNFGIRASSLYNNPYLFTGRRLDTMDTNGSLKLQYSRARYYDPQTGRFLQRDPLGINPAGGKMNPFHVAEQYIDGMNIFEYVKSNPVNLTDIYGLANGQTYCDPSTGKVISEVFNKKCTKACTKKHEDEHVSQHKSCCKRWYKCREKGKEKKSDCNSKYSEWFNENKDERECDAYKKSVSCAKRKIFWGRCKGRNKCTQCCKDLESYLKHKESMKKYHCGKATKYKKCPFSWSGKIK